jgi:hypothetical protein
MHHAKSTIRLTRRVACAATAAGLAVAVMGAAAAAPAADPPRVVDIDQITIIGSPKLFVGQRGSRGFGSAWIVFQTRPRLRTVRQVVVRISGERGLNYTSRGRPACIRSTIVDARTLKAGSRYRVQFHARTGRTRDIEKLLTTRTLTARTFASGGPPPYPDCLT